MTLNLNEIPRGGTMMHSKAGLVISSTAANYGFLNPQGTGITFSINGLMYYKANTADIVMTAAAAQGLLRTCLYLVCIDASGTLTTIKGIAKLTADLLAGNAVLDWPTPVEGTCPIGAIKCQTIGASDYTAGTTALTSNGTSLTTTYYDFMTIPVNPLTS
jgi:hypothetical protein